MTVRHQIIDHIGTTAGSHLYRARRLEDEVPVILKQLDPENADPGHFAHFRREYLLLQSLNVAGIAKPTELITEGGCLTMVLDNFPGETLESVLNSGMRMDWPTCLGIASRLAQVLAAGHTAHLIHQDIRPANILVALKSHDVLLVDCSIAASKEQVFLANGATARAGDWPYVSPEQTGRMNRTVDCRTDFYSFGITLYRMLTDQLPFAADDPLEWAHCHIARAPKPPRDIAPDVPQPVSDIVMKLLAKLPEDRYQSMDGVRADLDHCLTQWQSCGSIAPFPLGAEDVSERFQIPHKLYGREQERTVLLSAFDRMTATGQPALVTVSGYAGIGKSALVGELHRPIVKKRGYFISGKFDQYRRNIPYATLTQAFQELVRQLLAESEARIAGWRQQIREALGINGQLIVDLLPQVELIIGKQAPVAALPPDQAEHRFRTVFRQFVGVFTRKEHSLVLFLDDVQWIDPASLKLIEHLLAHAHTRHLLLITAYRDNEVGAAHPLIAVFDAIRHSGAAVDEIKLVPLPVAQLNRLVADTLHVPQAACDPLTRLLFEKTGGNPFFFIQFLDSLHKEGLLQWHTQDRSWQWDLDQIKARDFADNVVDLMVGKLQRLPEQVQEALQLGACIGNKFDMRNLALVSPITDAHVQQRLSLAIHEDLIVCADGSCKFLHDRIQQAAYSLIPQERRSAVHLRIGRALMAGMTAEEMAEHVFDVANQLNLGAALLVEREERARVAELNLHAGRKAKASTAYVSACRYFATGMTLLDEDDWKSRHRLAFDLWLERANCEFMTGNFEAAQRLIAVLLQKGASKTDLAATYRLKVLVHQIQAEHLRAVDSALACLCLFGIDMPAHPSDEQVRQEYQMVWRNLDGRSIESLIDMPLLADPEMQAVMDMSLAVHPSTFFTNINLSHLLLCHIVNLSIQHGLTGASAHGCAIFGVFLCPLFHCYQEGYRFARLACNVVDKHGFSAYKPNVYFAMGMTALWTQPVTTALDFMRAACRNAIDTGDFPWACYCLVHTLTDLRLRGDPLEAIWRESEQSLDFVRRVKYRDITDCIVIRQRFIANMRGQTTTFSSFNDAGFDEAAFEAQLTADRTSTMICDYWIFKLMARFLSGDYRVALAAAQRAKAWLWAVTGHIQLLDYSYYTALTVAALYEKATPAEQREWRELLAAHQAQLREWAENYPPTFHDKFALVSAEIERLNGQDLAAMRLYEQAMQSAHENGFVHNEGIACELAATFCLARGFPAAGTAHLKQARNCYARWGADGKVWQLDARYPQLRAQAVRAPAAPVEGEPPLDLLSVSKASQAGAGRMVPDELIDTLMRIMIENAGAQTGCLLLVHHDELALAADATVELQTVRVRLHEGQPPPQAQLPMAILNYVRRSREHVLLMNAAESHPFSADPYFAHRHPKSILCLPILRQSALVGLLYLENDLATHAFTSDRVKVLKLLASQAAVSLENNAQLCAALQQEHSERKRAEEAVQERNARIHHLIESNIIGVFFWDLNGNITEVNDAFLQMTGYSRQDVLSGNIRWTSITPPEYRAADAKALKELEQRGNVTPYEKEYIRKDGSRFPILIGGASFSQSQQTGVAFVLDLTERKRAEAERDAQRAAEAANRAKSAFLAHMSHELRTPLNGILGYAQILQYDQTLDERQIRGVNVIRKSGEHLLMLINDILDFAKTEAGRMELCLVDIHLARFVRTIAEIIGMKAEQKNLKFICDMAPDLPPWIRADEKHLRQVLLNLLSNAVKFTGHGHVALRVRFAPSSRLRFEVQDTGIGIAADRLEAIFEPFEQAGDAKRPLSTLSGTGLGLAISRQYVRLMGGEIEVESRLGQGSTFRFELQVAQAEMAPARIVTGYAGPRKKILVVDDIAENRAVVVDMLSALGFEVIGTENGRMGLEIAQRLRPHLILMDIAMPELEGREVAHRLRKMKAFREVPIIALSASTSDSDSEKNLAAGMNAVLSKPLDPGRLLRQIATLLQLDWTYDLPAAGPAPKPVTAESMVVPPVEELEVLHRLAKLGNMHKILERANYLDRLDERYRPLASQLRLLARNYQSQAILRLVEWCLDEGQVR